NGLLLAQQACRPAPRAPRGHGTEDACLHARQRVAGRRRPAVTRAGCGPVGVTIFGFIAHAIGGEQMERANPTQVRHPSIGEIRKDFPRPPKEIVTRRGRLPTANVSDAMAKAGVLHHEVKPLRPGLRACGPAFTCSAIDLTVKKFALSLVQPGDVFVLAAGGVDNYSCLGELASNIL